MNSAQSLLTALLAFSATPLFAEESLSLQAPHDAESYVIAIAIFDTTAPLGPFSSTDQTKWEAALRSVPVAHRASIPAIAGLPSPLVATTEQTYVCATTQRAWEPKPDIGECTINTGLHLSVTASPATDGTVSLDLKWSESRLREMRKFGDLELPTVVTAELTMRVIATLGQPQYFHRTVEDATSVLKIEVTR